jgi:hypothetical protein
MPPTQRTARARQTRAKTKGKGKGGAAPTGRRGRRAPRGPQLPSVASHPRAAPQVKRAKAWAGLVGFALVAFVSWRGHVPFQDMVLRAVAGGVVAYLVTWGLAVGVWRHLVLTELRVVREQREQELAEQIAAAAAAKAAASSPGDDEQS